MDVARDGQDRPRELRSLQDVLERAMEVRETEWMTELERLAKANGYDINNTTLNKLQKGRYLGTPRQKTVEALAFLAQIPVEIVKGLAGTGTGLKPFSQVLPTNVDLLTGSRRRTAIEVLKILIEAEMAIQNRTDQQKAPGRELFLNDSDLVGLGDDVSSGTGGEVS